MGLDDNVGSGFGAEPTTGSAFVTGGSETGFLAGGADNFAFETRSRRRSNAEGSETKGSGFVTLFWRVNARHAEITKFREVTPLMGVTVDCEGFCKGVSPDEEGSGGGITIGSQAAHFPCEDFGKDHRIEVLHGDGVTRPSAGPVDRGGALPHVDVARPTKGGAVDTRSTYRRIGPAFQRFHGPQITAQYECLHNVACLNILTLRVYAVSNHPNWLSIQGRWPLIEHDPEKDP